ncbi:MAG TPA: hypothetical protein VHL05_12455 [Terriglobales bacterium]|nr:hypothetical protein [Terriglobales bacterium]
MPFIIEVQPPWNVGPDEPEAQNWGPAMLPNGTPQPADCTFDSQDVAIGYEAMIKFQLANGAGAWQPRITRVRAT